MACHSLAFNMLHLHYLVEGIFLISHVTFLTLGLYRMLFLISQAWRGWGWLISYEKFLYGKECILYCPVLVYFRKCSRCTNTFILHWVSITLFPQKSVFFIYFYCFLFFVFFALYTGRKELSSIMIVYGFTILVIMTIVLITLNMKCTLPF